MITTYQTRLLGAMLVVVAGLATITSVSAQGFGPPQTIFGSITDSGGPVAERLPVEAYIGETLCGKGSTEFVGEGASRVTVYALDVVEKGQTAGCGSDGVEVRIKIGDRFATQTARWRAGPLQVDILFGSNSTPAPIPTFTPVPPTAVPTAAPATTEATPAGTPAATDGTPTGTTVASSTAETQGAATASASVTVSMTTSPSATSTLAGGVVSSVAGGTGSGDDDGLPVWGIVIAVLAGIAVLGGGVGLVMARARANDSDSMSQT